MKPEYRLNAEPSIDIIRITEKHMLPVRKQRQFPRNKQYQTTSLYSYRNCSEQVLNSYSQEAFRMRNIQEMAAGVRKVF